MSIFTLEEVNQAINMAVDETSRKAVEVLSSVLDNWVHGGDADCIIAEFEGKPLCSECGRLIFDSKGENPRMIPGKWHGKFPKRQATDAEKRMVDRNGRF